MIKDDGREVGGSSELLPSERKSLSPTVFPVLDLSFVLVAMTVMLQCFYCSHSHFQVVLEALAEGFALLCHASYNVDLCNIQQRCFVKSLNC